MSDPVPATNKSSTDIQSRLSNIEAALELDERLIKIEANLASRTKSTTQPWWRNAKTVTILGALIAAILPLVTAIDGVLKNQRESERLVLEQQDKIRQTYLDRVLRAGITEGEQQRIFGLLGRLKSDPEFREWAVDQYNLATSKLAGLIKAKETLEEQNKILAQQLDLEKQKSSLLSGAQSVTTSYKVQELERKINDKEKEASALRQRIGEIETPKTILKIKLVSDPLGERFNVSLPDGINVEVVTPVTMFIPNGRFDLCYTYNGQTICVNQKVSENGVINVNDWITMGPIK